MILDQMIYSSNIFCRMNFLYFRIDWVTKYTIIMGLIFKNVKYQECFWPKYTNYKYELNGQLIIYLSQVLNPLEIDFLSDFLTSFCRMNKNACISPFEFRMMRVIPKYGVSRYGFNRVNSVSSLFYKLCHLITLLIAC